MSTWYKAQMRGYGQKWHDLPLLASHTRSFGLKDDAEAFAKENTTQGTQTRVIECDMFGRENQS